MEKKQYKSLSFAMLELQVQSPILAASIIDKATINNTGQEIGKSYDFSVDATGDLNKHFNHEWE